MLVPFVIHDPREILWDGLLTKATLANRVISIKVAKCGFRCMSRNIRMAEKLTNNANATEYSTLLVFLKKKHFGSVLVNIATCTGNFNDYIIAH